MDHHADIEPGRNTDWTALHLAALHEQLEAVRTLCEKGALHYAARNGQVTVIRELVKWGANLEAIDFKGRTPLELAIYGEREDALVVLRELGAKTSAELWRDKPSDG